MKHLTEYKLFELKSEEDKDTLLDIKDCFLNVSDLLPQNDINYGLRVRITDTNSRKSLGYYLVNIKPPILPNVLKSGNNMKIYRPSKVSTEFIHEIENSINLSKGVVGLEFKYAIIDWTTGDSGIGISTKSFKKNGTNPDSLLNGAYDITYLFPFLIEKMDMLREIRIYFDKV